MTMSHELLRQPVGEWLRRTDRAITQHVDRVLRDQGLTRAHWQVLNVLATRGALTRRELLGALQDFVDQAALRRIVDDVAGRGWLAPTVSERLDLTVAGREGHERVSGLIGDVRRRSMEGITKDEYVGLIRTLQRMVANLERVP
jgi:DNA-binding MarR family transcriptional regulator